MLIQGVTLATEPGIPLLILTPINATKFEQQYVRCVRNEEECVSSARLFRCNIFIGVRIIKEMPGSVAGGTPCIFLRILALVGQFKYFLLGFFSKEQVRKFLWVSWTRAVDSTL
jgi:hypothetical protein